LTSAGQHLTLGLRVGGSALSQSGPAGAAPAAPGGGSALAALPAAWVGVVVLLSIYGIWQAGFGAYYYEIPDRILYFIYAGFAAAAINILWGLALLGLAIARSPRFPRGFIVWQVANIAWALLREAYVVIVPDFMVAILPLVLTVGEIAIGVFCIQLLSGKGPAVNAYAANGSRDGGPSTLVVIVAAIFGIIVGGAVGFGIGLGGGIAFSEFTHMSCFEGACGFFAFFMGLFGLIIGAVAGGILAVWLMLRRRRSAPPAVTVSN
jgi:hypothetical protein